MANLNILEYHTWQPLAALGITHDFFTLHVDTIVYTWIALIIIFLGAFFGRQCLAYPHSIQGHCTELIIRMGMSSITQSFGHFIHRYFFFIAALFIFILTCNLLILIPGCEEPTKDLNTTVALALLSFLYTQKESFKALGPLHYLQEYMKFPFSFVPPGPRPYFIMLLVNTIIFVLNIVIGILTLPLEALSKVATIISLSFRLFGNIFGGSMIYTLWNQAISGSVILQLLGTTVNIVIMLFFGLFEGFIQAFVFSILSLTYLSMAIQHGEIAHIEEHYE